MKCTVAVVVLALALTAAQASVLPLIAGHGLLGHSAWDGTHQGLALGHGLVAGHGLIGHSAWDGTHHGLAVGHGLVAGHGLIGSSAVHVSTAPLVAAVAHAHAVPLAVAHEGCVTQAFWSSGH